MIPCGKWHQVALRLSSIKRSTLLNFLTLLIFDSIYKPTLLGVVDMLCWRQYCNWSSVQKHLLRGSDAGHGGVIGGRPARLRAFSYWNQTRVCRPTLIILWAVQRRGCVRHWI